jgi:hypothetical protein
MAITTAMCNSFKQELLQGLHDLDGHTFNVALIADDHTGTYGAATTNYSDLTGNSDEAVGTNYTPGGQALAFDETDPSRTTNVSISNGVAYVDFDDEVFSNLTISADGAIIYNVSSGNRAVAVFDFGGTVTSTSGDFTIVFPTNDSSSAVIRIS